MDGLMASIFGKMDGGVNNMNLYEKLTRQVPEKTLLSCTEALKKQGIIWASLSGSISSDSTQHSQSTRSRHLSWPGVELSGAVSGSYGLWVCDLAGARPTESLLSDVHKLEQAESEQPLCWLSAGQATEG